MGQSPRVLIIDDEPGVRTTRKAVLEMFGFEVETAATVAEAVSLVKRGADIAIIDLTLERSNDGLEIARVARGERADMKLILATGGLVDVPTDGLFDGFFMKSAHPLELVKMMNVLLGREQAA